MEARYVSDSITVTTVGTKFKPDFDIKKFSFYSESGNYKVRFRCGKEWGPWINGFPYVEMSDELPCIEIEVKAVSESIQLHYYIRGER